ncbi:MAG: short-chain dehydrogenase [Epulopiscium sp. Nele67-Bin001]|nr:MAG: short-chain dehydrogenase [Epulopiscium sp. Nuni2H_MBin001]OON91421.1 MAG: short-chain dehydrogenase [Epulopiscium sp. Nele67-Bin001]
MKKIALITGATSGIGLTVAQELGKAGYTVVVTGLFDDQGAEAVKQLSDNGIEAEYIKTDATNEEDTDKTVKQVGEKYGKIDVLVNNVGGLGGRMRYEVMTTDFYRKVMALNMDSVFYATRAAIPFLKKGENPSIINYASIASYNGGGPGAGIYGASKAAVLNMTISLAKDLAEYGIRVNAVSPGTIDTPFHAATDRSIVEGWKNQILMKRLGEPQEVATVIEFLVSDKASFLTGEVIQINGGQDFR